MVSVHGGPRWTRGAGNRLAAAALGPPARRQGRVYGPGQTLGLLGLPQRVYHGLWGSAPFQRVYDSPLNQYESLLLIPEWYLSTAALVGLAALGIAWRPLLWALPLAGRVGSTARGRPSGSSGFRSGSTTACGGARRSSACTIHRSINIDRKSTRLNSSHI